MSDTPAAPRRRIDLIDAVRGLSIILMVAYHVGYDLIIFLGLPIWLIDNALLNVLQPFFAGVFILLSGVSGNFSRSNIRRGLVTLALALCLTAVTYLFEQVFEYTGITVRFGILHFMGAAMLLYGFARRWLERIPGAVQVMLFGGLFIAAYVIFPLRADIPWLWWLGIIDQGFASADYFPLLPWVFLFFFGGWLGSVIKAGRFPERFYTLHIPLLPAVGRHTLIIYLAHQPALMLLIWALQSFAAQA